MKKLVLLSVLLLSGCFDDVKDIKKHIATVKTNTKSRIEPMPEVPLFSSFNPSSASAFCIPNVSAIAAFNLV